VRGPLAEGVSNLKNDSSNEYDTNAISSPHLLCIYSIHKITIVVISAINDPSLTEAAEQTLVVGSVLAAIVHRHPRASLLHHS
jgi:hypothetical protein